MFLWNFPTADKFLERDIIVKVELNIGGLSWGSRDLKCQNKLGELSILLQKNHLVGNPLDLMCQVCRVFVCFSVMNQPIYFYRLIGCRRWKSARSITNGWMRNWLRIWSHREYRAIYFRWARPTKHVKGFQLKNSPLCYILLHVSACWN